jgi:oxygen-independent coproporphyrinogen-3 oxidase
MICENRKDILKFDQAVPRYTSYPPAPHFQKLDDPALYTRWLQDLPAKAKLSLYAHVPFCPKLCWYCGCNTKITQRYAPVEDYVHLMLRELEILADHLPCKDSAEVHHMHFGGGSPGMVRASDFALIMDKVRSVFTFAETAEIAIEIDPRELTEGRAKAYAAHGVNRISLGVQDFDQTVLDSVNRPQPFELSQKAVEIFRDNGIQAVNFDLLYGLPHQTPDIMEQTIRQALTLNPDRISLFGYAHVPWMQKHMRLIDENALPDKELRFDLFETGAKLLQENGYVALGIDHFAKADDPLSIAAANGKLKRNFQGYTTDDNDALIGIGASSIGKLPQGYIQNAVEMPLYKEAILGSALPATKYYAFTADDKLRSDIIEELMCHFSVDLNAICKQHECDSAVFDPIWDKLDAYKNYGFVSYDRNAGTITINPETRQIARLICALFDAHRQEQDQQTKRHAKAI